MSFARGKGYYNKELHIGAGLITRDELLDDFIIPPERRHTINELPSLSTTESSFYETAKEDSFNEIQQSDVNKINRSDNSMSSSLSDVFTESIKDILDADEINKIENCNETVLKTSKRPMNIDVSNSDKINIVDCDNSIISSRSSTNNGESSNYNESFSLSSNDLIILSSSTASESYIESYSPTHIETINISDSDRSLDKEIEIVQEKINNPSSPIMLKTERPDTSESSHDDIKEVSSKISENIMNNLKPNSEKKSFINKNSNDSYLDIDDSSFIKLERYFKENSLCNCFDANKNHKQNNDYEDNDDTDDINKISEKLLENLLIDSAKKSSINKNCNSPVLDLDDSHFEKLERLFKENSLSFNKHQECNDDIENNDPLPSFNATFKKSSTLKFRESLFNKSDSVCNISRISPPSNLFKMSPRLQLPLHNITEEKSYDLSGSSYNNSDKEDTNDKSKNDNLENSENLDGTLEILDMYLKGFEIPSSLPSSLPSSKSLTSPTSSTSISSLSSLSSTSSLKTKKLSPGLNKSQIPLKKINKSKDNFKTPRPTKLFKKPNYLSRIVSPVSLYIKNSPKPTIKRNIMEKRISLSMNSLSDLSTSSEYKKNNIKNYNELPLLIYTPSKQRIAQEIESKHKIPISIKKFVEPVIFEKHTKRTNKHINESDIRKKLDNESFNTINNSTTKDISYILKKELI